LNDYLGLANHPEVRKADTDAAIKVRAAYPMGARMMSGHTKYHEQLENELATFVMKESAYLLNLGTKVLCQQLTHWLQKMMLLCMT
jgi:glycine C-acetyltransferase